MQSAVQSENKHSTGHHRTQTIALFGQNAEIRKYRDQQFCNKKIKVKLHKQTNCLDVLNEQDENALLNSARSA